MSSEDQSHGFKKQNESTYTKAIQISDNIHATMNWKSKFIENPIWIGSLKIPIIQTKRV